MNEQQMKAPGELQPFTAFHAIGRKNREKYNQQQNRGQR